MRCPECREYLPDIEVARYCPTCGAELPDSPRDPLIGVVIAERFRITDLVAEGGMGRIYAAQQPMGTSVRKVAIKMLLAESASKPQDVARFMRECSTVCELEHPNTVKFYDYGQTDEGDLFIAMEFLSGDTLAGTLKQEGALSPERVDWIMSQITGSLQEAHDKGIVHRDVKPDNILLTNPAGEADTVKVVDFGIAKRPGSRDQKLTPLGVVLGSPPYMSPEQFSLQDIDRRSDIYSLGVVAYQALTGRLPFRAKDMIQWATLHMVEPPRPFSATEAGQAVPDTMRDAVLRALSKDPRDRPQTMREFYELFTIGAGKSMPPGRTSRLSSLGSGRHSRASAHALRAEQPPPPLEGGGGADRAMDGSAIDERAIAGGSGGAAAPPELGKSGTVRLASSAPPPGPAPVVPELVPPTVRDPVAPIRFESRRALGATVVMALGALLVGGGFVVAGLALEHRSGGETDESEGDQRASPTASEPSPFLIPTTLLPTAFPTATPEATATSTGPDHPRDACEQAVVAAINGDCDTALKFRGLCSEQHPDHALAHRAYDRRCKPR